MRGIIISSVTALCILGMLGGCLIIAGVGFTSSGKRGDWHIFVPAPQAYIMSIIMFAMSGVALLWLLQLCKARALGHAIGVAVYVGVAAALTWVLS